MKYLEITAKRDGFRRCGMRHPATPTRHLAGVFDEEQVERLKGEPLLVVVEVNDDAETNSTPDATASPTPDAEASPTPDAEASPTPDAEANAKESTVVRPETAKELIAAIVGVIPSLDAATDFTQAGAPKVKAVEAALGYDVQGGEVAAAWAEYEAQ